MQYEWALGNTSCTQNLKNLPRRLCNCDVLLNCHIAFDPGVLISQHSKVMNLSLIQRLHSSEQINVRTAHILSCFPRHSNLDSPIPSAIHPICRHAGLLVTVHTSTSIKYPAISYTTY